MMTILTSVLLLGVLGLVSGTFLAYAAKKFEVKEDPKVREIVQALPGVNCGACGFPGCEGFGKAVAKGEASADGCIREKGRVFPKRLRR